MIELNLQVGGTNLSVLYAGSLESLVNVGHGAECFLLLLHLVIPALELYLSYRKNLTHINFTLVVNFIVAASYPMVVARFMFILYERGFFLNNVALIATCSMVRGWYLFGLLFTQSAAVIERFICSIYIETYERTRNLHVAFILIAANNGLSILFSSLMLLDLISFQEVLVLLGLIQVVLCPLIIKVLQINRAARHKYTSSGNRYSLSMRFQVNENFRIMRLTINLIILSIFLFFTAGVMLYLRINVSTPIMVAVIGMFYQIFMTSAPLFFFTTTILSFHEHRSHLLTMLGCRSHSVKVSVVDEVDTKRYFQMLAESWK